jgi:hypothetical protein
MTDFFWGVIIAFIALCLYGEGYRVWHARRPPVRVPISAGQAARIYDPLFAWVLDAEENGTITEQEAAEAIDALIEAEGLERQFLAPAMVDGPREQML